MRRLLVVFSVFFAALVSAPLFCSPTGVEVEKPFGLVIHGGAGHIIPGQMSPEKEKACRDKLAEALAAGYDILKNNGSGLDAVEKVITILEDSPLFNAGKGAVFTHEGKNELDASIMEGKTRKSGAVAGVTRIKNPIALARLVMEKSPHVMLAREGAEMFAKEQGMAWVPENYFYTEDRWTALQKAKEEEEKKAAGQTVTTQKGEKTGTVGCVVLDKHGNLASGVSTGGMTNKRFGRIGDSPIIGAGAFADNDACAVSCTGHGEFFIRWVAAYDIAALMMYKNLSLQDAAETVVMKKLKTAGGAGGIIAIDHNGHTAAVFNTTGMFRAWSDKNGKFIIRIFSDEDELKQPKQ